MKTSGDRKADLARLCNWTIHETSDGEYSVSVYGKRHHQRTAEHSNVDDALDEALDMMNEHLSGCPLCR